MRKPGGFELPALAQQNRDSGLQWALDVVPGLHPALQMIHRSKEQARHVESLPRGKRPKQIQAHLHLLGELTAQRATCAPRAPNRVVAQGRLPAGLQQRTAMVLILSTLEGAAPWAVLPTFA